MQSTTKKTDAQWEELQGILAGCCGEWTSPDYPGAVNPRIPNTTLLGNGDVGISSDGSCEQKSYRISKGDFWEYRNAPLPVGILSVGAVSDSPANGSLDFRETEDILNARIVTEMTLAGVPMVIRSWMCAVRNLFVTEITSL
ncbi:MAG: hypothetical protein IKX19_07575, partial [Clostridia bacterium]|nr:hypothetical protein [Clostridia bacterium]